MDRFLGQILICLLVALRADELTAQDSIVANGGFEEGGTGWSGNYGLCLGFEGAAEGRNFAGPLRFAEQSLQTVPSQVYRVRFAVSGNSSFPGSGLVRMIWGGSVTREVEWQSPYTPGNGLNFNWRYGEYDLVATEDRTLLRLERLPASTDVGSALDDVSVVPIASPPETLTMTQITRDGILAWMNCASDGVFAVETASTPTGPWLPVMFATNQTSVLLPEIVRASRSGFYRVEWRNRPELVLDYTGYDSCDGDSLVTGRVSVALSPAGGSGQWSLQFAGESDSECVDEAGPQIGTGQTGVVRFSLQDNRLVITLNPTNNNDQIMLDGIVEKNDRSDRCSITSYQGVWSRVTTNTVFYSGGRFKGVRP